MSRIGKWFIASLLMLSGCSVPSLEELAGERTVRVSVQYTPSFKTGCIVMRTQDMVNAANFEEQTVGRDLLSTSTPPLALNILGPWGWGKKLHVTITAFEQTCAGKKVDQVEHVVDLGDGRSKTPLIATLETPDWDGDGFVATSSQAGEGGSDCDDGDAMKNPLQQEICDDRDNDCRGGVDEGLPQVAMFRDSDGDGVGGEAIQHCVPAAGVRGYVSVGGDCKDDNANVAPGRVEVCDNEDNNCNGATDEGFDKNWYLDDDGDGVPRAGATVQCGSPGVKYKQYSSGPPFDCKDDDASVAPGNLELCDNKDNNCNGDTDETFTTKGNVCNNLSCSGTLVCNAAQNGVECNAQAPRMFYPDKDGDLDGEQGVAADEVCVGETPQPGWVENLHTDCDDVDPATRSGRAEVCDGIDNDCNGQVDDGSACGGMLKEVVSYHLGGTGHDWKTVAVHPSGYPVWIAGRNGKLVLKKSAASKFESFSFGDATTVPPDGSPRANANNCGDHNWTVSWVDAAGNVWLGGEGGWIAVHSGASGFSCSPGTTPNGANITGLVGFPFGGGSVLYITDTTGRLYRFVAGALQPFVELDDSVVNYYGLHGYQEEFLLAVGGLTGSGSGQRFRAYAVAPGGFATVASHSHSENVVGNARAVWMGSPTKACAVGDNGAVWRWDSSTTWNRVAAPSGVTVPFSSVVMRSDPQGSPQRLLSDQCYIVDASANGRLRRLTPYGWAKGPDLPSAAATVALNDLAITQAGEIWVVGEDGRVFHYPEP
ncbi:putative metal-binding motif-containing protein [Myxococcus sp. MISCRS1]|uniref:putative metal-binding motif-containing protein n=1 Tax=Myxococcus sp. MISCRS1 TaxID=2996786 RepID=UPI00226E6454|nr:putative metal-binding motif-containing protein [Myxococcus sp. MISCRS1]MCY0999785.1 putative metal-binding motif-containing protein [Myxococcus sp. MISCRS1]